jgi:hypothetical protein
VILSYFYPLICNLINGSQITADNIDKVMKQLRERIFRLLKNGENTNRDEKETIEYIQGKLKFFEVKVNDSLLIQNIKL